MRNYTIRQCLQLCPTVMPYLNLINFQEIHLHISTFRMVKHNFADGAVGRGSKLSVKTLDEKYAFQDFKNNFFKYPAKFFETGPETGIEAGS